MSSTPTTPVSAPLAPPVNATAEIIDNVTDALAWGLSLAFPALAPVFAGGNKALDALVPWVILAVQGKKLSLADLKAMQTDLNQLGPSFPAAGGYSNAFAGGANPAPGTTPARAPGQSATITVNGATVTVTVDTLEGLLGFLTGILAKKTP